MHLESGNDWYMGMELCPTHWVVHKQHSEHPNLRNDTAAHLIIILSCKFNPYMDGLLWLNCFSSLCWVSSLVLLFAGERERERERESPHPLQIAWLHSATKTGKGWNEFQSCCSNSRYRRRRCRKFFVAAATNFYIFLSSFENPFEQMVWIMVEEPLKYRTQIPGWNNDEQDTDRLKNYVSFFLFFLIPVVFLKLPIIGSITCSLLIFTCQVGLIIKHWLPCDMYIVSTSFVWFFDFWKESWVFGFFKF